MKVAGDGTGIVAQLHRRAPDDNSMRGHQCPGTCDICLPVLDLHVESAVHLQNHDATAVDFPFTVGVPPVAS
jgi:hypothetical protein